MIYFLFRVNAVLKLILLEIRWLDDLRLEV
jgi:hypothetical protein